VTGCGGLDFYRGGVVRGASACCYFYGRCGGARVVGGCWNASASMIVDHIPIVIMYTSVVISQVAMILPVTVEIELRMPISHGRKSRERDAYHEESLR